MTDTSWAVQTTIQAYNNTTGDTSYNTQYTAWINEVNREIDNWVFKWLDGIPLSSGLTNDLIEAANYKVASKWCIMVKQFTQGKTWDESADKILESVKTRAIATPTTRQTIQGVNKGYYSNPLQTEGLQPDAQNSYSY